MLLSIYILFQLLVIAGMILLFYSKEIIFSTLTMLFAGTLAVGAWRLLVDIQYVFDPATGVYVAQDIIVNTPYLASINIGLFGLALMFFFYDIFELITKESIGLGNLNLSRNKKTEENLQTKRMI